MEASAPGQIGVSRVLLERHRLDMTDLGIYCRCLSLFYVAIIKHLKDLSPKPGGFGVRANMI